MIVVVGAGGIGANTLLLLSKLGLKAKAIDRDFVDGETLGRQMLYDKGDAGKLKADVVNEKLGFPTVADHLNAENAAELIGRPKLVLDCTDNYATRRVINDYCLEHGIPWVFSSAIRSEAMAATIIPDKTPCFACFASPSTPRSCSVEGISPATTSLIAAVQVQEALNVLKGTPKLAGKLFYADLENMVFTTKKLNKKRNCVACVKHEKFHEKSDSVVLCGDNEYLFLNKAAGPEKTLRFKWRNGEVIALPNGRVIVKGLEKKEAVKANEAIAQKLGS